MYADVAAGQSVGAISYGIPPSTFEVFSDEYFFRFK
jgi:hypothetical protein